MQEYFARFPEIIASALPDILAAILIIVGSYYLAKIVSNLLKKVLTQRKADTEVILLLTQVTRWSIIVIGMITGLQRFFDVTAFLAGLGILGFTVGFALQDIMQNFMAGVILLVQQPFEVQDAVEVDKFGGTILAINLRTTEMETFDGRIVIIPNASVLSNPIINYTRAQRRRVELSVGVSYDTDPTQARKVVSDAIQNVPGFVKEPQPMVIFHTFAGSSIEMTAYFWIDMAKTNLLIAKDSALELVKTALEKNKIQIPFPTTIINIQQPENRF